MHSTFSALYFKAHHPHIPRLTTPRSLETSSPCRPRSITTHHQSISNLNPLKTSLTPRTPRTTPQQTLETNAITRHKPPNIDSVCSIRPTQTPSTTPLRRSTPSASARSPSSRAVRRASGSPSHSSCWLTYADSGSSLSLLFCVCSAIHCHPSLSIPANHTLL